MAMTLDLGTVTGIAGVILTVVFFLVGYRQTIGARKERAASANREIVDIFVRRIILEGGSDINGLTVHGVIRAASVDYNVPISDMLTISEIGDIVFSRIFSNDYISVDIRRNAMLDAAAAFRSGALERGGTANKPRRGVKSKEIAILSLLSAVGAAAAAIGLQWILDPTGPVQGRAGEFFTAIAVISILLGFFAGFREVRLQNGRVVIPGSAFKFHQRIKDILQKGEFQVRKSSKSDYVVQMRRWSVAVELAITVPRNAGAMKSLLDNMDRLRKLDECQFSAVVYENDISFEVPDSVSFPPGVRAVQEKDLLKYLKGLEDIGGRPNDADENIPTPVDPPECVS